MYTYEIFFIKLSAVVATMLSMAALFTGLSSAQSYNLGTAAWSYQMDAKCYQIFYKESVSSNWQFSLRCLDTNNPVWQYIIKYLKPGVAYTYRVKEIANIDTAINTDG